MACWKAFDAGGDNNNCMILSVLACAPHELGPCTAARARDVRKQIAAMIAGSAGTELGKQAYDAMRVLHAWKTANPAEFTPDVSCPVADHCMHIEDPDDCLRAAGNFVRGHHMLGAIELPFLKAWAAERGVHVIEVTSESGGLDADTAAWVDAQVAQAPADKKVAVIVSDSVHYQALLREDRKATPEEPAPSPVVQRRRPTQSPKQTRPTKTIVASPATPRSWTMSDVLLAVIAGAVLFTAFVRPLFMRPSLKGLRL